VVIYFDLDKEFEGWFESAVDCSAFLAFRLAERGAQVRFCTQEFDLSFPDEGDIYSILKYLALVSPAKGKAPAPPDDPSSFQIVFSSNPRRMTKLGWGEERGTRMIGPDAFSSSQ
jgi:hypothetical protein